MGKSTRCTRRERGDQSLLSRYCRRSLQTRGDQDDDDDDDNYVLYDDDDDEDCDDCDCDDDDDNTH